MNKLWQLIALLVVAVVICFYFTPPTHEGYVDVDDDYNPSRLGPHAWGGRDLRWRWHWPKSGYAHPIRYPKSRLYWWL